MELRRLAIGVMAPRALRAGGTHQGAQVHIQSAKMKCLWSCKIDSGSCRPDPQTDNAMVSSLPSKCLHLAASVSPGRPGEKSADMAGTGAAAAACRENADGCDADGWGSGGKAERRERLMNEFRWTKTKE